MVLVMEWNMKENLPMPEILLSEPTRKKINPLIYISMGAIIGMINNFLFLKPLVIGFHSLISIIQEGSPQLLDRHIFKIFSFPTFLSILFIGIIYGGILGYLFYLFRSHHHDLKTFHRDFELQVAALRHHYKNLALGIQGFSQRVAKKAEQVSKTLRQKTEQDSDYQYLRAEFQKLENSATILDDTAQRLSLALKKELGFLKALTAETPTLESRDFYSFLIACIQELLDLRFQDKKIRVEINGQPFQECRDSLEFPFEPNVMEVICQNLLSNAMNHGDHIDIRVTAAGNLLRLEIQDNGPGLEVEKLKHSLYTPAKTAEPESTQLGLKVTLHLLREFGGNLRAKSAPGAGATFILEFPLSR
jgi:signal transduction histidine kinase